MKAIYKAIYKIAIFFLAAGLLTDCSKSYLDRPSQSQISSDNFYQTRSDLRLATANLYGGAPWWLWNTNAWLQLGDMLSGNAYFAYAGDYVQLFTRTITSQNSILSNSWTGLYNTIGQCNMTINAIQTKASSAISAGDKNAALGEARFIRGVAYYHLALLWGAVPIIEDNTKLINNPLLSRNITTDVYKFITNDLTFAAQTLPASDDRGRVTTWSAQGMLAKVYLTMAGLGQSGGTRNQSLLDSAAKYAGNVCNNSGLSLFPSYYDLFKAQNNDVPEDLFSLQWSAGVGWGQGNALQANFGISSTVLPQNQGGWQPLQVTYDLYQCYSAKDTVRRKASFSLPGDYYPELNNANGGFTATGTNMKKHTIGNDKDNNSPTMTIWCSIEHNAILRLSDVYLIYAEAVLGNNASTADAGALTYFNKVRVRAGIDPVSVINIDSIYKERRIEFAYEGQYWYDLVRMSYYNPAKAIAMLNNQQRMTFTYSGGVATPDTTVNKNVLPATLASFTMQLPASEVTIDPKLTAPPVAYY